MGEGDVVDRWCLAGDVETLRLRQSGALRLVQMLPTIKQYISIYGQRPSPLQRPVSLHPKGAT